MSESGLPRQDTTVNVEEKILQRNDVNREAIACANDKRLRRQSSSLEIVKEKAARITDVNKEAIEMARDRSSRRHGSNLNAIKAKTSDMHAINREAIEKVADRSERRQNASKFVGTIKNEVAEQASTRAKGRKSRRRLSLELNSKFGHDSLSNIDSQKSSIAELRPARRKIKWNKNLSDWERMQQSSTRLDSLNMEDLHLPGRNANGDDETESEGSEGMTIEELEKAIRKAYKGLKRVRKEAKKENNLLLSLQQQNQELRRNLVEGASLGVSQARQPVKRINNDLDDLVGKNADLDQQIEALLKERESIERKTESLRQLENDTCPMNSQLNTGDSDSANLDEDLEPFPHFQPVSPSRKVTE